MVQLDEEVKRKSTPALQSKLERNQELVLRDLSGFVVLVFVVKLGLE